jgi:N6-L-threonylcarbamoyladenine synthase
LESLSTEEIEKRLPDLCASFQEAIVDVLIGKLDRAVSETGIKNIVVTGGVSANSRLRARAEEWSRRRGLTLQVPPLKYCTDNAAMIGYAGILRLNRGERSDLELGPSPSSWAQDFTQHADLLARR